jgi:localization factor PodJL
MEGVRHQPKSYRDRDEDGEGSPGDELAAVNDRLDELTRHIERMAHAGAGRRTARTGAASPDGIAAALERLDRRLDQMIGEADAAAQDMERRAQAAAPAPSASHPPPPQPLAAPHAAAPDSARVSPSLPADWLAQISNRQRALDDDDSPQALAPAQPQASPAPQAPGPMADATAVEQQLQHITAQIASLRQPFEGSFAALRDDLAELGRALTEAAPRRAVEALETQVGSLAERIDRSHANGATGGGGMALAGVEQGLAEVRDALRGLTPAENLVGVEDAVRGLSRKIDQIGPSGDPAVLAPLEQAVASLRGLMSNVASEGALAQLAAEVHGLAAGFERAAAESSSKLEARLMAVLEDGRTMPPRLEEAIRSLNERIDRMTPSRGDQLALTGLEDRIAKLSKKLDSTDARLSHLESIERGIGDLLVQLEDMRSGGSLGPRAVSPAGAALETAVEPQPVPPPLTAAPPLQPVAAGSESEQAVEEPPPEPTRAFAAVLAVPPAVIPSPRSHAGPNARVRAEPLRPIDPDLPPDTPIEPGTGVPRARSNSAAARIAVSEAALGGIRPMAEAVNTKSAAIAAARNAVKASYLDGPAGAGASSPLNLFQWLNKARKQQPAAPSSTEPRATPARAAATAADAGKVRAETTGHRIWRRVKAILIAASVAIIILGVLQAAFDLLMPGDAGDDMPAPIVLEAPPDSDAIEPETPPADEPLPATPEPEPAPAPAPQGSPNTTGSIAPAPAFPDLPAVSALNRAPADATGSIAPPPLPAARTALPNPTAVTPPAPTSPTLRAAIAAQDPAAEYEMAVRYAEGRGVPQDLREAARWLERSSNAGFVPAQFRLAGLNEKGEGVKKDLPTARRLYLSAANKGHAKAMHNLAVLHAEGAEGAPDYTAAARWFSKAAAYGITDSQYNLAILYARGIGVEANLAESYRWFALAAARGDQDAAKKRDEVAKLLDPQTLMAAKLAVQTFSAQREPDEATALRVPPGGWDRTETLPTKPRPRTPASSTR